MDPLPIKEMVQDIHSAEPNPTVSESEEAKWLTVSNLKDAFVCSLIENKSHPSLPLDRQTLAKSCSTVLQYFSSMPSIQNLTITFVRC